jgi:hypothetical protein
MGSNNLMLHHGNAVGVSMWIGEEVTIYIISHMNQRCRISHVHTRGCDFVRIKMRPFS